MEKFVFVIAKFTIAERTAGGEGSSEVGEKRKICLFPLLGGKKTKRSSSRENENEKCENIMGKSVEAKKEKKFTTTVFAVIYRVIYGLLLSLIIGMSSVDVCRKRKKRIKKKGIFL